MGFVLTGGRSTRMGRDKAMLPLNGQTLSEHVGDVVATVATRVLLVGHPERYGQLKYGCIPDLHPGLGPLSGLEAALALNLAEWNVVAGCDMVNLRADWLRALLSEACGDARCVVAESPASGLQPLCAVYRQDCLDAVSRAIQARRLRMMDLLAELGARSVRIEGSILNANTPGDYGDGTEQTLY